MRVELGRAAAATDAERLVRSRFATCGVGSGSQHKPTILPLADMVGQTNRPLRPLVGALEGMSWLRSRPVPTGRAWAKLPKVGRDHLKRHPPSGPTLASDAPVHLAFGDAVIRRGRISSVFQA